MCLVPTEPFSSNVGVGDIFKRKALDLDLPCNCNGPLTQVDLCHQAVEQRGKNEDGEEPVTWNVLLP